MKGRPLRAALALALALGPLAALAFGTGDASAAPVTRTMLLFNTSYRQGENCVPNGRGSSMQIRPGDSLAWQNCDPGEHTVTADDGSFDSGVVGAGATFLREFPSAGTFPYHCTIHPSMQGSVTVKASSTSTPTTAAPTTTTTAPSSTPTSRPPSSGGGGQTPRPPATVNPAPPGPGGFVGQTVPVQGGDILLPATAAPAVEGEPPPERPHSTGAEVSASPEEAGDARPTKSKAGARIILFMALLAAEIGGGLYIWHTR